MNEATARIRINTLLEKAGWRFFPDGDKPANVSLEQGVTISQSDIDDLGEDFEKTAKGFIDFLLLDSRGFPLVVLEAKSSDKNPLVGKEQARKYARSQDCRFIILSNGNIHYLWDLERGNPHTITAFPSPDSFEKHAEVSPNPLRLINERVEADYVILTQRPGYASEAAWRNESERPNFINSNGLRLLRDYQIRAVHSLQQAVKDGSDRFLFEMATGTGKTLVAAAIVKLFLRTRNARRVLFLVDRLELEEQAKQDLNDYLSNDFDIVVYKEKRDDWRHAEIVVTTVQSLLFNNKYQSLFSPTDFDLVISDEAHRSISGNARSVFDYFVGYKLGLTATPRDYLRGVSPNSPTVRDPREVERRLMLDTYRTFGCESGEPTYRYTLIDGVKGGHLISPTVVDARTDVTTQLLADEGFIISFTDDEGEYQAEAFKKRDFERKFFSEATNKLFCRTFMENALHDPVSAEIGKSIVFAVSQDHAAKLVQAFNEIADIMFPGKYRSDFAVQVTSHVPYAQRFTINFKNNNLLGSRNFLPEYDTSKARVCVTVGMMTTGYDCTDILNIGLFRPIFSPTDFVQIKGRGTRKHNFLEQLRGRHAEYDVPQPEKTTFKLFDFFGNCEYFETEFDYDQVLKLPLRRREEPTNEGDDSGPVIIDGYEYSGRDVLAGISESPIGPEGMKVDRMLYDRFASDVCGHEAIRAAAEAGQWDLVDDRVIRELFNKPEEFYNLERLRKAVSVDRRVTIREFVERALGLIPRFKSRDDLLEEEFDKFIADHVPPGPAALPAVKMYFKAYVTSDYVRSMIDSGQFAALATHPGFSIADYRAVPQKYRSLVREYVKDYVSLNQFAA